MEIYEVSSRPKYLWIRNFPVIHKIGHGNLRIHK